MPGDFYRMIRVSLFRIAAPSLRPGSHGCRRNAFGFFEWYSLLTLCPLDFFVLPLLFRGRAG